MELFFWHSSKLEAISINDSRNSKNFETSICGMGTGGRRIGIVSIEAKAKGALFKETISRWGRIEK